MWAGSPPPLNRTITSNIPALSCRRWLRRAKGRLKEHCLDQGPELFRLDPDYWYIGLWLVPRNLLPSKTNILGAYKTLGREKNKLSVFTSRTATYYVEHERKSDQGEEEKERKKHKRSEKVQEFQDENCLSTIFGAAIRKVFSHIGMFLREGEGKGEKLPRHCRPSGRQLHNANHESLEHTTSSAAGLTMVRAMRVGYNVLPPLSSRSTEERRCFKMSTSTARSFPLLPTETPQKTQIINEHNCDFTWMNQAIIFKNPNYRSSRTQGENSKSYEYQQIRYARPRRQNLV